MQTSLSPSAALSRRFAVAPMIDWTDRHCRFFHRQLTRHALLYTEMVVADAILHGDRDRLLGHDASESPVALQIGGSEPQKLAEACRIAADFGYDEINLNVGCPSDRVQSGAFGACLMREPDLVGRCLAAMVEASDVPVTVKCRIGVDEQDPEPALDDLADAAIAAGVTTIWVHARKAWLQGLSPKENRDIPPLDYPLVLRMKQAFPELHVSINGGIASLAQARELLDQGLDGVMIGRAAYHAPTDVLAAADREIFGQDVPDSDPAEVVARMLPYIEAHLAAGGKLAQVTRHMLGLFAGQPGARLWRRVLSEGAHRPGAGPELVERALAEVAGATPVSA